MSKLLRKAIAAAVAGAVVLSGFALGAPVSAAAESETKAAAEVKNVQTSGDAETPSFDYLQGVGNYTAAEIRQLAKTVYDGLKARSSQISLSVPNKSANQDIYIGVYMEVAQSYDVGLGVQANSYRVSSSSSTINVNPTYTADAAELEQLKTKMNAIASLIDPGWTDIEKALFLHDYLAEYFDYSTQIDMESYLPQSLLKYGDGVCSAYSMLYAYILNNAGVPCTSVSTDINGTGHQWNIVKIGSKWYHVDVTFDDGFHGGYAGLMTHDNFLRTTSEMIATDHVSDGYTGGASNVDWKLNTTASVRTMNVATTPVPADTAYWDGILNAIKPIVIDDDPSNVRWVTVEYVDGTNIDPDDLNAYNMAYTSTVYLRDVDDLSSSYTSVMIAELGRLKWYVVGSNSVYVGSFAAVEVYDNVIFVSTPSEVFSFYGNGDLKTEYQLSNTNSYIYGLRINDDGDLCCYLSTTPGGTLTTEQNIGSASNAAASVKVAGVLTYDGGEDIRYEDCVYKTWTLPTKAELAENSDLEYVYGGKLVYTYKNASVYPSAPIASGDLLLGSTEIVTESQHIYYSGAQVTLTDTVHIDLNITMTPAFHESEQAFIDFEVGTDSYKIYCNSVQGGVGSAGSSDLTYTYSLDLSPREIYSNILITPCLGQLDENNEVVSVTRSGTIRKYNIARDYLLDLEAGYMYGWYDISQAMADVVKSLRIYGHFASAFFYDADDLANGTGVYVPTEEYEIEYIDADADVIAAVDIPTANKGSRSGTVPDGIEYTGSSLVLRNMTRINHYFKITDNSKTYKNFEATAHYADDANTPAPCRIARTSDGFYIEVSEIAPFDMAKDIVVTIKAKNDDTKVLTLTYSPVCYAATVIDDPAQPQSLKNLVLSMYNFHLAALAYDAA